MQMAAIHITQPLPQSKLQQTTLAWQPHACLITAGGNTAAKAAATLTYVLQALFCKTTAAQYRAKRHYAKVANS
jgi:hypothetical protein